MAQKISNQVVQAQIYLGQNNLFEILVFSFNKYTYELCTCVNMEIYTCAENFNTPVLITTCDMPSQIQVAK